MASIQSDKVRLLATSGALLVTSLMLTVYSSRNPQFSEMGFVVIAEALTPLQQAMTSSAHQVQEVWGTYVDLVKVRYENTSLKERVSDLERMNAELVEARLENSRLQSLLRINEEKKLEGTHARVIGVDPSGWVKALVVDKGSSAGVEVGMGVVSGAGIVGQVVATGRNSSRVLLVTDHSSGVDVLIQEGRLRGTLEGTGENLCSLKFVPRDFTLTDNERVVTSGLDGVFPKGLLVGLISELGASSRGMFQRVIVKPFVDLDRLEEVLILPTRRLESMEVYYSSGAEPAKPAPTPTTAPKG